MSVGLATKGIILGALTRPVALTPFSPIWRFYVELTLKSPGGLYAEELDPPPASPKGFAVESY